MIRRADYRESSLLIVEISVNGRIWLVPRSSASCERPPFGPQLSPSVARRAQLIAPALVARSVAMRRSPRTRPRRPPNSVGRDVRLAFDEQSVRPIGGDLFEVGLFGAADWRIASCSWIVTERPARELVQAARSGQLPPWGATRATSLRSLRGVVEATRSGRAGDGVRLGVDQETAAW